jgi:DNA-3-methyladenine glycosylase II
MNEVQTRWRELAAELQRSDARLAPFIAQIGPPEPRFQKDPFRALVCSILSQQLATKAAAAITEKFRNQAPPFPTAPQILAFRAQTFKRSGVSAQKASYLKALSKAWTNPSWRRGWHRLEDEALIERLVEVKGIGEWTAHMFLIFSLGRTDILPVGDYGVRRGIQLLFQLPEMPKPKELAALVPHWKGAASVASWYLWKAMDRKLLVDSRGAVIDVSSSQN